MAGTPKTDIIHLYAYGAVPLLHSDKVIFSEVTNSDITFESVFSHTQRLGDIPSLQLQQVRSWA